MDPFTPIAATINSSLRIFEVTYQLKAVGEQTADLLETTRHVDTNLNEARRLRRVKESLLNNNERNWVDSIVDDTENALQSVARLIEPARIDKATKEGINFGNRFLWVFRDNPQVRDKHARLSVCHQSLTAVIACLYSKDVMATSPVAENKKEGQPPPYDSQLEELFNWRNRRRRTKSSMAIQRVAAESPMPTERRSTDSMVANPMNSVPTQSGGIEQNPPSINSHSAPVIHKRALHPHAGPTKDAIRSPPSVDAVPTGRIPPVSKTLVVGPQEGYGRRPICVDNAATAKPVANLTREAMIQQRQADEQASNSRLPYPMSPSDYMTVSTLGSDASASMAYPDISLFSSLELPHFDAALSKYNTRDQHSCMDASSITKIARTDARQDQHLPPAIDGRPSTPRDIPDHRSDGADGLQLLMKQSQEQYQHPPFSFSSFAPLASSDDDSQQVPPGYVSEQNSISHAYEGLQLVADLGTAAKGTSNQGQDPLAHMENSTQGPTRSPPVSPGRVRRGGRSWLMFHASRSNLGQSTG